MIVLCLSLLKANRVDRPDQRVLLQSFENVDVALVENILREARARELLNLSCIIRLKEIHYQNRCLFTVSEFNDGGTLGEIMRQFRLKHGQLQLSLPEDFIKFTIYNIALCIKSLHSIGVEHK